MTSTDLITSLASMTSTASLASKNQKQPALYLLSDFPCIRDLIGLNDLYSLNNLGGLNDLFSLISSKKLLSLMFPSTLAPKWPFLVTQCWIDHRKATILLILGTLSVRGCGGQECYFWPNQRVIHQIPTSQDSQTTFKLNLTCIFISARARYFVSKPNGWPCTLSLCSQKNIA